MIMSVLRPLEGEPTVEVTNEGVDAAGHTIGTSLEVVFKLRKVLNPKSVIKPTSLVKDYFENNIYRINFRRKTLVNSYSFWVLRYSNLKMIRYLPVNGPWLIDQMPSRAYVSQFSADGSLFVAGFQGNIIKIYNVDKGWKVQKNILTKSLRWTITDTSLSPDQRSLVYASMSPIVHIVNVGSSETESLANVTEIHDGLDFSSNDDGGYSFGIFSVKFSTDGRELVAGTSGDSIHVYDLEANKVSLQILAHAADVNTVCFADETGHLIYSGSDDSFCKVCDRRCLNAKGKPAGVLMGHLEGITFIDTRGDGRYFISNGKDQTIKLWDLCKISSNVT
ncbi:LEC14B protein-like [Lathyrus oleraceus]|nr:LEC14B protein-like [Pisum sativum]